MYAATFLLGLLGAWKSKHVAAIVAMVLIAWCALLPSWFVFYRHTEPWVLHSVLCYAIGAVLCVFQLSQRATLGLFLGVAMLGAGAVFADWDIAVPRFLASIALTLGAIWLGRTDATVGRLATRFGDLSYGVFLYSAPVQQMLVWARPGATAEFVLLWSAVLSLTLAFLSWRLVEGPMLKLKLKRP